MLTPDMGNRVPDHGYWALDNACFNNPDAFDLDAFMANARKRLAYAGDRCLFVVAPDVPFDSDGTLRRFDTEQAAVRSLGAPVALVSQDGMEVEDVPWPQIDTLFVGGSTAWKTGQESAALVAAARRRGKWTHMGRVNSMKRMKAAESMGCDSVDGTYLKYGPAILWPKLRGWLDQQGRQPTMVLP